ncbi:hypothetical protein OGAPHI_005815 [Ogataea philodendri]|uniref:Uncharacterized protein n=1 Tax=Ogataea philodendri TaxID=1378263 RepID=A0A9P8NZ38_9ASCO|nr:uncharacterized protein OGAPHI_005815 [Ogataea philodendri]KAH3662563.1 hypothetical protein OGAPHI_005815 [Ogataea philodendri]
MRGRVSQHYLEQQRKDKQVRVARDPHQNTDSEDDVAESSVEQHRWDDWHCAGLEFNGYKQCQQRQTQNKHESTSVTDPLMSILSRAWDERWKCVGFGSWMKWWPTRIPANATGTWNRKHHLQPNVSAITPPSDAPQIDPNPSSRFWKACQFPLFSGAMMSELTMVAKVTKPPPPIPVIARKKSSIRMLDDRPHPRHPTMKKPVAPIKQALRPSTSENEPYRGWNAVLVIRYDEVIHEAVLAALNSLPIVAYVDAVTVPSKPDRKTLANRDSSIHTKFGGSPGLDTTASSSTSLVEP